MNDGRVTDHHALPNVERRSCRVFIGDTERKNGHSVHVVGYRFRLGNLSKDGRKRVS
jgi:hypothetical protein